MRILIVDDSVFVTMLVSEMLSNNNIDNIVRYNGKEAVDLLLTDNNFDIILMDIEMPIMNGIDAIKKIRSFLNIPIIVVTSTVDLFVIKQIKSYKLVKMINKPFDFVELMKVIKK